MQNKVSMEPLSQGEFKAGDIALLVECSPQGEFKGEKSFHPSLCLLSDTSITKDRLIREKNIFLFNISFI